MPIDPNANLTPDQLDATPLRFGKYRGQSPSEIAEDDPGYIVWLYDNVLDKKTCSKLLRDDCEKAKKLGKKSYKDEPTREITGVLSFTAKHNAAPYGPRLDTSDDNDDDIPF